MTDRDPLSIAGQTIAEKYCVERLVGEGGFAVVYRAQHTIWNRPVAIKFFNGLSTAPIEQRDELQHAFIQEGALLTELSSQTAGIVQARDVGAYTTPSGQWMPYMVLEWLDGHSLEEVLENEQRRALPAWSERELLGFLSRVLPPLDVAHAQGIAHRDIKPANLFVLGNDARSTETPIKILDFGVAKMVDNTHLKAALAKTGVGITSFTPQYGAPEQFTRSFGATGPWTDVYAMALVAVELLTGRTALQGDDLVQLGYATANVAERPTPRARGAQVTDALEQVFQVALAVDPKHRFASAAQFLKAVEDALGVTSTRNRGSERPLAHPPLHPPSSPPGLGTSETVVAPGTAQPLPVPTHATGMPTTSGGTSTPKSGGGAGRTVLLALVLLGLIGGAVFLVQEGEPSERARAELKSLAEQARQAAAQLGASAQQAGSPAPVSTPSLPSPRASSAADTDETRTPTVSAACPKHMAKVDATEYRQGSDATTAEDDEKPAHSVALDAYCIDLFEVTAAEYGACVTKKKCRRPSNKVYWPNISQRERQLYPTLCTYGQKSQDKYPINCISWKMADTYCKAQGKRLPTEAEWEYAARGGEPRNHPWGDEDPTPAHLNGCDERCATWGRSHQISLPTLHEGDDGFATLAPVGKYTKGRSPFGLYDMAGNVREWVADWHGAYPKEPQDNPSGPKVGKLRVIRGAGWNVSYVSRLRPSYRGSEVPNALSPMLGFRCAQTLMTTTSTSDDGQ